MRMLRSFLPVGQGAFYREAFITKDKDIHNVVYDCGSTSKKIIEGAIDREFRDGDTVDAVFISHFHSDHINGLKYLVEHCNVKNIFFPFLAEEEKGLTQLFCLEQDDEDVFVILDNMENPEKWGVELKNPEIKTWFVSPEIELSMQDYENNVVQSGRDYSSEIFGSELSELKDVAWKYVPFNFRQEEKIQWMKEILTTFGKEEGVELPEDNDYTSFFKEVKDNKELLKKWKEALNGKDGNTNSMVVFSGTCKNVLSYKLKCKCMDFFKECKFCDKSGISEHVGCLYTGDYDASSDKAWEELEKGFDLYWERIGCLQIPHHGSSHNYNPKIIEKIKKLTECGLLFCIISAGVKNKYGHPYSYVIKDLVLHECFVNVVTEDGNSRMDLEIYDSDY